MASDSQHMQEGTAFSLTETIIERRSPSGQESIGFVGLEEIETTPKPFLGTGTDGQPPLNAQETLDSKSYPPFIPPDHPSRLLILCFDGTGDQFDSDNSNIVQLVSLLKKDDRTKQLVYYQAGIGTYTSPKVASPWMASIQKTLDVMFATSLHAHVMSGYEFLMQNWTAGDRICIFGFSRGAYTARSLAGMIHKVGLLPPDNKEQVPFAYTMYLRTDTIGWEQSNEFKRAFSINVDIEFIGVWDTVDSVGIFPKRLPFTTSNTIVKTFRHAVSLDEHRAKFKANLWNRPTAEEAKLGLPDPSTPSVDPDLQKTFSSATSFESDNPSLRKKQAKDKNGSKRAQQSRGITLGKRAVDSADRLLNNFERMYSEGNETQTDIEEVWFAGCHCDIGGGSVSNKTRNSLARISLRWMIREVFKAQAGIIFISDRLFEIGLDPTSLYPLVKPRAPALPVGDNRIRKHPTQEIPIRNWSFWNWSFWSKKRPSVAEVSKAPVTGPSALPGSEEEEELNDALSPIYDQLHLKKSWWVLEYLPLRLRYQRGDNQWVSYVGLNLGRPRFIPKQSTNGIKIHRSVKLRMEAQYEDENKRRKDERYEPRAAIRANPTWID